MSCPAQSPVSPVRTQSRGELNTRVDLVVPTPAVADAWVGKQWRL